MTYILHNAEAVASAFATFSEKIENNSIKLAEAKELIQGYAKLCHIVMDEQPEETFTFDLDRYKNLEENWVEHRDACLGRLGMYAKLGQDISLTKVKSHE